MMISCRLMMSKNKCSISLSRQKATKWPRYRPSPALIPISWTSKMKIKTPRPGDATWRSCKAWQTNSKQEAIELSPPSPPTIARLASSSSRRNKSSLVILIKQAFSKKDQFSKVSISTKFLKSKKMRRKSKNLIKL